MKGELYINDKDAYVYYGAFLENGGEAILLTPPSNKDYASNDARSQHGKQVFVSNARVKDRNFVLVFCISAGSKADFLTKYRALVDELSGGLVLLKVSSLGVVFKLIALSYQEFSFYERLGKLSVKFSEPNPKERVFV